MIERNSNFEYGLIPDGILTMRIWTDLPTEDVERVDGIVSVDNSMWSEMGFRIARYDPRWKLKDIVLELKRLSDRWASHEVD